MVYTMECLEYLIVVLCCNIVYGRISLINGDTCASSNNCSCTRSLYKTVFHCPNNITPTIIINIETEYNAVNIRCVETLDWHDQDLPFINLENTNYIRFHQCPFPINITEIINRLKVSTTKELRFYDNIHFTQITLTADCFKSLYRLERLILRSNNIHEIDQKAFKSLDKLIELNVDYNRIQLKDGIFHDLSKLKFLSLSHNQISHIPEAIFKYTEELQKLNLAYNKIQELPHKVFSSLTQLETLNLENNLITYLQSTPFRNLGSLEKLNLRNNNIKFIDMDSFRMVYNLKEIILANNYFDMPKNGIPNFSVFNNNHELRKVDLSNNCITRMDDFHTNHHLIELDLSYNQISYLSFAAIFTPASAIHINLTYNNITTVDFEGKNFDSYSQNSGNRRISLNGNPMNCNCKMYDFVKYFDLHKHSTAAKLVTIEADKLTCSSPNNMIDFPVTKLNLDMLMCSLPELGIEDRLTDKCSYQFYQLEKSLIINCTNANFTEPPELILPTKLSFNQTVIYLENNLLSSGPKKNMGYEDATKLFLSSNYINEITWLPPKLEILELHNNNISYLNYEILKQLNSSTVTHVTLRKNPWNCNCLLMNLTTFVILSSSTKHIDANSIECKDSTWKVIELSSNAMCPNNTTLVLALGVTISATALFIAVLIALYYGFQQEIKVWLFAHNMFIWFVTEEEIDKEKQYDAFISYSHKDEHFVLNELLPVLEKGPQQYKLCLHIRDWIAGEFISKQIATSVAESRRTVVILSRSFVDSEWGKMEFRTAHKQAIHERRARVILIMYGNIDINSDLDDDLKAYVRTNTYIKWGDPGFWNKLRYALPHSRDTTKKKLQKHVCNKCIHSWKHSTCKSSAIDNL